MRYELIRSSYAASNERLFCEWDRERKKYCVGTRWVWLYKTTDLERALHVFEALTFAEEVTKSFVGHVLVEIKRIPFSSSRYAGTKAQWEREIIQNALKREAGLRPIVLGSHASVIVWERSVVKNSTGVPV